VPCRIGMKHERPGERRKTHLPTVRGHLITRATVRDLGDSHHRHQRPKAGESLACRARGGCRTLAITEVPPAPYGAAKASRAAVREYNAGRTRLIRIGLHKPSRILAGSLA
jgi:hypothetical protein